MLGKGCPGGGGGIDPDGIGGGGIIPFCVFMANGNGGGGGIFEIPQGNGGGGGIFEIP